MLPNGERYLRVGGTRQRQFAGTSLEPRNLPENAASPTRRVHAVLGAYPSSSHDKLSNHDKVALVMIPVKNPVMIKIIRLSIEKVYPPNGIYGT